MIIILMKRTKCPWKCMRETKGNNSLKNCVGIGGAPFWMFVLLLFNMKDLLYFTLFLFLRNIYLVFSVWIYKPGIRPIEKRADLPLFSHGICQCHLWKIKDMACNYEIPKWIQFKSSCIILRPSLKNICLL